jgi:hypothetical protein
MKRRSGYLLAAFISLGLLILLDQMRLQPWVYQYLIMLLVLSLAHNQQHSRNVTISLVQLLVAALYFWSGAQKLNYSFHQEVLPQLLGGIKTDQRTLLALGIIIALIEMGIGLGLLVKRPRRLSLWFAIAMHILIPSLLVALRINSIVWPWNLSMIAVLLILFHKNDNSLRDAFVSRGTARIHLARTVVLLVITLPLLSFFGWWDLSLSGSLYSGLPPVGVLRVDPSGIEALGEKARQQLFVTSRNEQMLPFYEWSIAELNVPPYSEERVFKQLAREMCRRAGNRLGIELIMKGQPERLTGKYEVKRLTCAQLDSTSKVH